MATADNIENTDSITSPVRKETLTIQRIPQDTVTLWSKASKPIVPPSVHEQNSEALVMQCFSHTLVITGYLSQDTVTLVITEYLKTL